MFYFHHFFHWTRPKFQLMTYVSKSTCTSEVQCLASNKYIHCTVRLTLNFYLSNHLWSPFSSAPQLREIYSRTSSLLSQRMKPSSWDGWSVEPYMVQSAHSRKQTSFAQQPHGVKPVSQLPLYMQYRKSAEKKKCCTNVFIFAPYMLIVYLMNSNIVSLCKQLSKYLQKVHC